VEIIAASPAFPVGGTTDVAAVRRAALRLAEHLRFSETRAGQVALVATELATNLAKHARQGTMLVQAASDGSTVELLSLDKGPGFADFAASRADGVSTSGTLGHGLGAIERQSDLLDVFTGSSGSAILARIGREAVPQAAPVPPRFVSGGIAVNAPGEQVCGDAWTAVLDEAHARVILADGLGHGLAAHDAARQALTTFRESKQGLPAELLADIHASLRATRGAAVTIVSIDLERGVVRCAGVGNVASAIVPPGGAARQGLVTRNGTAGHGAIRPSEHQYPYPPQSLLVLHSDGLHAGWDLGAYPGLRRRHPTLIAGVLYRDFRRERDDVSVAVVTEQDRRRGV
jgi:anti-sigma regulatory factor (Ser/Thr protein kinase)